MKRLMTMLISFAVLSVTTAFAQYAVKGVVLDEIGPIIGVTVLEEGTTNGTQTDMDGKFSLEVSSENSVLVFSFIGYETVTVAANQVSRILLKEDRELLDEVIVIGYGTVKKNDMTGSIVAIKADNFNRGAITSPDQMLVGKVAGLRVTPASGQPGASGTIRIRGAASLIATNDPLIVIDGVPITGDGGAGMGNPLASMNPNDIESYTILKDASATAIYGARASNGVIIVTTKRGKGKGIKVSYNSTYSIKQNSSSIPVMTGDEYREFMTTTYPNTTEMGKRIESLIGTESTDWQSEIYRLALNTDQSVSVYGGGEVFPFRVSLGYNYDQATLNVGDNQRGNVDISLSPKFFDDHLSVNVNLKGLFQATDWANEGTIGAAMTFDPTKPIYFRDTDGNIDKSQVSNGYWNWMSTDGASNNASSVNPLSVMNDWNNVAQTMRSIGNVQLNYKIHGLEDLSANVNLGYDIANTTGKKYNEIGSISAIRAAQSTADYYVEFENYNVNKLLEAYLNYNKEFSSSVLDVMAGYSWQHNYVSFDESKYKNELPYGEEDALHQKVPTNAREYYLLSFFGRVNYSIDSKYLFTATLRNDASSRFSKDNRWGLFPAAAFAWNMAEENWLKSSKVVSNLKFRLGWGRTGQQDIGDDYYPYIARYIQSSALEMQYFMNGAYGTTLAPIAYNPNIKWETTETYNVGVDFGFIDERITGSVEAYYRKTYDLLNRIPTPLGSNFGNDVISNIGDMENKGIEIAVNFIPIQTNDFHWSIGGNFTFQDTKITKLTAKASDDYLGVPVGANMGGIGGNSALHREGFTPNTYYLYQQLYDSNGDPVQNGLVDRNGDGEITAADKYMTNCSPTPWGYFGLNTQLRYKNWDFGINAHGSLGNEILNKVGVDRSSSFSDDSGKGYLNNLSPRFLIDGWNSPMGDEQKYSDMYIEDGSFLRIDDINLGYTFRLKNDMNMRLAASVQNVVVFTKYTGLDPELLALDGVDGNIIPRPRLYTLRLSINF